MQRDSRAYLADIIESCDAISTALSDMQIDDYLSNRLVRSSVEREFTIIGEALGQLSRADVGLFAQIDQAPQIISFRNKLTHEYVTTNNQLVWGVIQNNLPLLLKQCTQLLSELDGGRS